MIDAPKPRTKVKPRKCLQCDQLFNPRHKNNWVCRKCRIKRSSIEWGTWGGSILYDPNDK